MQWYNSKKIISRYSLECFWETKKEIKNLNGKTLPSVDENIQALLAYYAKKSHYFTKSCDLLFKIAVFENRNIEQSFFTDLFTIFYSSSG